jgi:multicomponent Na+:H+ antiporter subunit D
MEHAGLSWPVVVFVVVSAVTGGAVLRAALRIHCGLGRPARVRHPSQIIVGGHEELEVQRKLGRTPATMLAAVLMLGVGGLLVGLVPAIPGAAQVVGLAAQRWVQGGRYTSWVLHAKLPPQHAEGPMWTGKGAAAAGLATALAVLIALAAILTSRSESVRWSKRLRRIGNRLVDPLMSALHRTHSGHIGDYVAWLLLGMTILIALITVRV